MMMQRGNTNNSRRRADAVLESARITLIVMELVTAGISLICVIAFGYILKYMNWECPLYSTMTVKVAPTDLANQTVVVQMPIPWGQHQKCWFPLSISVLSAMGNFIWAWLLLHFKMRVYQEGIYHSYVFMAMVFEVLLFIFSFASSLILTQGYKVWCENIVKGLNYTCAQLMNLPWEIIGVQRNMESYMMIAKVSSWMTTVSLLLVALFALVKFYGSSIVQSCSRDKGEQYMTSPDSEKSGLPYSALPSVNSRLAFENNGHNINDNPVLSVPSPDD